ncbi:endonuclease/exonuclease/phosphatase family protein [Baekduia sp. Peel2402]|uniref:endonuclease/exonuclease/phosphatase family protein n=1 Tax=Baekduia sp. Peel2402 TaxID=3458296 RepID=UPI00403E66C3
MTAVRLATFNVENLFARWKFKDGLDPQEAVKDGWAVDETKFDEYSDVDKEITGEAIRELKADVLALQEVENVDTLKHFRGSYLGGPSKYPYVAGIDGNDPRLIDVVVISKLPIVAVRSNQHLKTPGNARSELFSRDCLEVTIETPGGGQLLLFVQHFKSMVGGRAQTHQRRLVQATAVKQIVTQRLGPQPGDQPFAVLGDFNDYLDADDDGTTTAIDDLVGWDQVENVVTRRPAGDQWTHYYNKGAGEYRQLDYLLLSSSLAKASPAVPDIMRKGMPLRAAKYTGPRFDSIGQDRPKASDHCPVVMDVEMPKGG